MSLIFVIMATPFLSATGVYNPQVVDSSWSTVSQVLAAIEALYCPGTQGATQARV